LPTEYVPEVHQRLSLYKRVSQARNTAEIELLRSEIRDRYGPLPSPVEGLLAYALLRLRAEALGVLQVDRSGSALHVKMSGESAVGPERLVAFVRGLAGAALSPQGVLRVPLPEGGDSVSGLEAVLSRLEADGPTTGL
jgi:transcription-repair coupling factor (superfamily II helicase)